MYDTKGLENALVDKFEQYYYKLPQNIVNILHTKSISNFINIYVFINANNQLKEDAKVKCGFQN